MCPLLIKKMIACDSLVKERNGVGWFYLNTFFTSEQKKKIISVTGFSLLKKLYIFFPFGESATFEQTNEELGEDTTNQYKEVERE